MRDKFQGFIIGVIVTLILLSTTTMAESLRQTIEVLFNQVNLEVNEHKVNSDNIAYNGTTYAPVRAVAEFLGKKVGWDGETQTVSIDDIRVNDEEVIGKWESIDIVMNIAEFNPNERKWNEDLYIKEMEFKQNGEIEFINDMTSKYSVWGDGIVFTGLFKDYQLEDKRVAQHYFIKNIDGIDYMFFEYKNGDYQRGTSKPIMYVLRRKLNNDESEESVDNIKQNDNNQDTVDKEYLSDKTITKAELIKHFVISLDVYDENANANFLDVDESNEYYHYLASAVEADIIDDNYFVRPDSIITRADFAVLLVRLLDLDLSDNPPNIFDIKGHWAENSIVAVVENGLMDLFEDGTFRPSEYLKMTIEVNNLLADLKNIQEKHEEQEEQIEYLDINKEYTAKNGLTVKVTKIERIEDIGSIRYDISYVLKNQTEDKKIDEGAFKLHFADGTYQNHYGFFRSLFPGNSLTRTYTFEFLKGKTPTILEYGADFFSTSPKKDTLQWKIN